jgi:uncharacterized protein
MSGTFVVRHEEGGQFSFVLQAENGEVVAAGAAYRAHRECLEAIDAVKRLAADARVEDQTAGGKAAQDIAESAVGGG